MVRGARVVGDSATDSVIIEGPRIYRNNPFISSWMSASTSASVGIATAR